MDEKNGDYHEINLKSVTHGPVKDVTTVLISLRNTLISLLVGWRLTDWTLTVVRTDLGRAIIEAMIKDGAIETRPGDDDPESYSTHAETCSEE